MWLLACAASEQRGNHGDPEPNEQMRAAAPQLGVRKDTSPKFHEVLLYFLWVRRDGASLMNRHINLKVFEKPNNMVVVVTRHDYEIDFNVLERNRRFPKQTISRERVLSMYYNNKGVDALIDKDYNRAYAYFPVTARVIDPVINFCGIADRRNKPQIAGSRAGKVYRPGPGRRCRFFDAIRVSDSHTYPSVNMPAALNWSTNRLFVIDKAPAVLSKSIYPISGSVAPLIAPDR